MSEVIKRLIGDLQVRGDALNVEKTRLTASIEEDQRLLKLAVEELAEIVDAIARLEGPKKIEVPPEPVEVEPAVVVTLPTEGSDDGTPSDGPDESQAENFEVIVKHVDDVPREATVENLRNWAQAVKSAFTMKDVMGIFSVSENTARDRMRPLLDAGTIIVTNPGRRPLRYCFKKPETGATKEHPRSRELPMPPVSTPVPGVTVAQHQSNDKEIRALVLQAGRQIDYVRRNGGHLIYRVKKTGEQFTISTSPSDTNAVSRARATMIQKGVVFA